MVLTWEFNSASGVKSIQREEEIGKAIGAMRNKVLTFCMKVVTGQTKGVLRPVTVP